MAADLIHVDSPNVVYTNDKITADYVYSTTSVKSIDCRLVVGFLVLRVARASIKFFLLNKQATPENIGLTIATDRIVPKLGLMLVGWGGNNGSTITAALEANRNKLQWRTKTGIQKANWFGSITQASTVLLGNDENGQDVFAAMNRLVPMVDPNDISESIYHHFEHL